MAAAQAQPMIAKQSDEGSGTDWIREDRIDPGKSNIKSCPAALGTNVISSSAPRPTIWIPSHTKNPVPAAPEK